MQSASEMEDDAADKLTLPDPKYEEEVSGCTASVGIITKDKIYVVCIDVSNGIGMMF